MAFTPEIQFGGASTGITYSFQQGEIINIGTVQWFIIKVVLTSKGSATGDATIVTLPRSSGATVSGGSMISHNLINTINYTFFGWVVDASGATAIRLVEGGSNQNLINLTDASFNNDTEIQLVGYYLDT